MVEVVVAEKGDDAVAGDAGVVHQDVDASPPFGRVLDETIGLVSLGDVGRSEVEALLQLGIARPRPHRSVDDRAQVSTQ